jgi:hypothetical protein
MGRRRKEQRPAKRIVVKIGDIVEIFPLDREYLPNRQAAFLRAKELRSEALQFFRQSANFPPDHVNDFAMLEIVPTAEDRLLDFPFLNEPNTSPAKVSAEAAADDQDSPVPYPMFLDRKNAHVNWDRHLW